MQNLIEKKRKNIFLKISSKSVLKELWKALKSLGLPNKFGGCIISIQSSQHSKHPTDRMHDFNLME